MHCTVTRGVTSRICLCAAVLLCVMVGTEGAQSLEDHYKTLEIAPGASTSEIRQAYHKASLKWHPDKNKGSKEAEKMFIKVQEAYEVLKDPQRRAAFDAAWKYQQRSRKAKQSRSQGQKSSASSPGGDTYRGNAPGEFTESDESFSFTWDGTELNFDELMNLMRKWEQESATLKTAKMAFRTFVNDLSDNKMRYWLDRILPIDSRDTFHNNMIKRVLRWFAWSARGLLRSFLLRLDGMEGDQNSYFRGQHSSHNRRGGWGDGRYDL